MTSPVEYDDYVALAAGGASNDAESMIKTLPHSIEAERCVVGCMMVDARVVDVVRVKRLTVNDFYLAKHRQLFEAVLATFDAHGSCDVVLCAEQLESAGQLIGLGGLEYLVELVRSVPSAANHKAYIDIVLERAERRRWIAACNRVQTLMFNEAKQTRDERMAAAEAVITTVSSGVDVDTRVSMRDALKQLVDYVDRRFNEPDATGLKTGFQHIDYRLDSLEGGQLIIIAGRPSMGKTTYGMQLVLNGAKQGYRALVYSMEMKAMKLAARLVANKAKLKMGFLKNPRKLEDNGYELGWEKLKQGVGALQGLPIVFDEQAGMTVNEVRARALQEHRKNPLGLIVVDYLQLVDGDARQSANDRVGYVSRTLKKLAMELDIPVIALSQLSRKVEERRDKRPLMSDLRDSGAIEQDADVIQLLYREEVYDEDTDRKGVLDVISAKVRDGETGTDFLTWLGEYNRIEEMAHQPDSASGIEYDLN